MYFGAIGNDNAFVMKCDLLKSIKKDLITKELKFRFRTGQLCIKRILKARTIKQLDTCRKFLVFFSSVFS